MRRVHGHAHVRQDADALVARVDGASPQVYAGDARGVDPEHPRGGAHQAGVVRFVGRDLKFEYPLHRSALVHRVVG